MFQVGDKIVHPMHGAGVVDSIVQKKINGVVRDYYILKLPVGGMMVMIPTENSQEIGVRPVMGKAESDEVIAAMPGIQVEMPPGEERESGQEGAGQVMRNSTTCKRLKWN